MAASAEQIPEFPSLIPALKPVMLQAEPEPIEIDLHRTALMVVDMQNASVRKGGMLDLIGIDISGTQKIIEPVKEISRTARARGCKVIYIVTGHPPDMSDTGGQNSPAWYKDTALTLLREHPEWHDKLTLRNTWGAEIIKELEPKEGDIIFEKMRYSAFFQTNLDTILKTYGIKYIVFTGTTINMCVEATIRDAYYLGYFPILVSDAAAPGGPPFVQDATIFNVKVCYGWVTTVRDIIKAMD